MKSTAGIGVKTIAVVAAAAVAVVGILAGYIHAMGSAHEELFVHRQLVEDPDLLAMIQEHCRTLEAGLRADADLIGPERIAAENAEVVAFVDAVRRDGAQDLGGDAPAEEWLDDWIRLVEVRGVHARELGLDPASPAPTIPTVDDVPIIERMNEAVPGCRVPAGLTITFAE